MKPLHKNEGDTAKQFLERIAADRGSLITDEEYASCRSWQLQTLTKPPRIELPVAIPWLIGALFGIGLLVVGLVTWVSAPANTTMNRLAIGILLAGLSSYFFFANVRHCRTELRRTYSERKTEIDDLLRSGLITAQEHETIRQAIENESFVRVQKAET